MNEATVAMSVHIFLDNELGYLSWVAANPSGYVVNTRRNLDPDYLVLHRAHCASIRHHRSMAANPGGFTERTYSKLCSESMSALQTYLSDVTGKRDPFSNCCSRCIRATA